MTLLSVPLSVNLRVPVRPSCGALSQVINAYDSLARLIHGEPVSLEGADDEEVDELDDEAGSRH